VSGNLRKNISWSAGYQFLFTGEQEVLKSLRDEKVFGRNTPNGSARIMQLSDYSGLLGRSPHMANIKVEYTFPENDWSANIRAIYRSRWGVVDLDGNGFANMDEEFAPGFVNLNMSVQKTFKKTYTLQVAVNNLLNHMDEVNAPNMAGTSVMATFICQFSNQ
jgi:outer membrane receptor for ferrienterochelin and colicins